MVAKLQQAAQSFTKYDGQILKLMLPRPQLLLPSKAYMISAYIKVTAVLSSTAWNTCEGPCWLAPPQMFAELEPAWHCQGHHYHCLPCHHLLPLSIVPALIITGLSTALCVVCM